MLETMFADGKFKADQVKREFCGAPGLLDAIDHIKIEVDPQIRSEPRLFREFTAKYAQKDREDIVEHIVNLRGFLHHHTVKRKDIWHPANQEQFRVDARVLLNICYHILVNRAMDALFQPDRIAEFLKTKVRTKDGQLVEWASSSNFRT